MSNFIKLSIGIIVLQYALISAHFDTLEFLQKYAAAYPEDIESSGPDVLKPEFNYTIKRLSFLEKIGSLVGIGHRPQWNPEKFKQLLQTTYKQHVNVTIKGGEQTIDLAPESKCIIWGDLHGAFHSLVRTLTECKRLGFIDANLHILQPDIYFIFLGNVINQSPYSLETLTIVLTLMQKNPGKIVYLQGEHETNGYWENFPMRAELKTFAWSAHEPEDEDTPLSKSLNTFFSLLPKILIIHRNPLEPDQAIYATHRKVNAEAIHRYETEVLIFGSETFESKRLNGLEFRGYMYGTALWSIISCPIPLYKKYYQFYYDCFAVLTIGDIILRSTITAYDQHSEQQHGFNRSTYDILYGIQVKDAAEIQKIHAVRPYEVGSTGPLSGGSWSLGRSVARGIDAALYNFNTTGGTSNIYVRGSMFDDELVPRLAQRNIEILKSYGEGEGATGGNIAISPIGTETLLAYFDEVRNNKIAVLFPYAGNKKFRDPALKSIINFIPSHADEIKALINYMITEYNSSNFAFFYQNDEYGTDALEAAHQELKKHGITTWTDLGYSREQTNFAAQITDLKKSNPDAIGFFSISAPTQEFINQVGASYFSGRHLFSISFAENLDLRIFLNKLGVRMTFTSVVPNPHASDIPLVQEYQKSMDFFKLPYNTNSLEGFIAGELFLDALKKTQPPFTKEKVLAYFEGLKNYAFKGLTLTFNPQTRSLSQPVFIITEDNTWIQHNV